MNRTILTGRLTKDVEMRSTQNGTHIVRFTLAVDRKSKEKDKSADFISCVAYAKVAELVNQYVKKGHKIGIIGHIQTGSYERDGKRVYTTDVIVDELEFLESKKQSDEEFTPIEDDGDLPF
jgi:single-strand DNA-binding protein